MSSKEFLDKLKRYSLPDTPGSFNLSPSLLSEYLKYRDGVGCGEYLLAYVRHELPRVRTEPMAMGEYFEWKTLGKEPSEPVTPDVYKTGKNAGKPKGKWSVVDAQVENWRADRDSENARVIARDLKLVYLFEGISVKGIIDYVAAVGSEVQIRDLKLTGVINSDYSKFSWSTGNLPSRRGIIIQGLTYIWLFDKIFSTGLDIPMAFDVYSSKDWERKQVHLVVDNPGVFVQLEELFRTAYEEITFGLEVGLTPRPSGENCSGCPVVDCPYRKRGQDIVDLSISNLSDLL